jgi:hypothetical protein
MAEKILELRPKVVGIGVYIWNASRGAATGGGAQAGGTATQVIVLGGPEVSHLPLRVDLGEADYLVQGKGSMPSANCAPPSSPVPRPRQGSSRRAPVAKSRPWTNPTGSTLTMTWPTA